MHSDDRSTPEPANLDLVYEELLASRASLSPSRFPQQEFRDFKQKNRKALFEKDVMTSVIPVICGDVQYRNQQDVLFTELTPLTTEGAVRPKPDFFDGADLEDLDRKVRDKEDEESLYSLVIPTKHPSVPVAPNFYLEAKARSGGAHVAQRQACYDGAIGARATHALQNYGAEEPAFDGNAYTYSSTYHDGHA